MADWTKMRKKWTDNRDEHGVKKGAVSGVNVGDAIDKVMKAEAKGYTSVLEAAKALDSALTKYKAKIAKSNPDFVKWIDKNIGADVDSLSSAVKVDLANVKWANDNIVRELVYSVVSMAPNTSKIINVEKLMRATPPKTWAQAITAAGMFTATLAAAPEVVKRATRLKTMKWSHALPGHDGDYKAMTRHAEFILEDVKFFLSYSKAADRSEFLQFVKETGMRNSSVTIHGNIVAAIKSLLS